jgi:hypothetical protein
MVKETKLPGGFSSLGFAGMFAANLSYPPRPPSLPEKQGEKGEQTRNGTTVGVHGVRPYLGERRGFGLQNY